MRFPPLFTATLLLLGALPAGLAQVVPPGATPGGIQQREREARERFRIEQALREGRLEVRIEAPDRDPTQQIEGGDEPLMPLERLLFEPPSEILDEAFLNEVRTTWEGRIVSLNELLSIIDTLNGRYDALGFPTARAVLPPQDVDNGEVRIQLVEGRVGMIELQGSGSERYDAYVRRRLGLAPGELVSIDQLEEGLVRFNRLNESRLRAELAPGAEFGTTDLFLNLAPPQRLRASVFVDNLGRETNGEIRLGAFAQGRGLIFAGDTALAVATFSNGTESFSGAYSVPITQWDTVLELAATTGDTEIIEGAFEPLDINGDSRDLTIGLLQPVYVSASQEWAVFARFSSRESLSFFGGVLQEDIDLAVFSFGGTGQVSQGNGVWFTEQRANVGMGSGFLGGEEAFFAYRGTLSRLQRLGSSRFSIAVNTAWQLSDDADLPPSEQFQIGGSFTVRGASEGLLAARRGYFASVELIASLRSPFEPKETGLLGPRDRLDVFAFADHGGTFPFKGGGEGIDSNDFLQSVGVGSRFEFTKHLTGRIAVAVPLGQNDREIEGNDVFVHFAAQINIF